MATLIEWLGYLLILLSLVPVLFLRGVLVEILAMLFCLVGAVLVFTGAAMKYRR